MYEIGTDTLALIDNLVITSGYRFRQKIWYRPPQEAIGSLKGGPFGPLLNMLMVKINCQDPQKELSGSSHEE